MASVDASPLRRFCGRGHKQLHKADGLRTGTLFEPAQHRGFIGVEILEWTSGASAYFLYPIAQNSFHPLVRHPRMNVAAAANGARVVQLCSDAVDNLVQGQLLRPLGLGAANTVAFHLRKCFEVKVGPIASRI